jgi:hypothetical protein
MCRSLGGLKSNVHNKVAIEGCIMEGYIATELVTFCSAYLSNAPIVHHRSQRNVDGCRRVGTCINLD